MGGAHLLGENRLFCLCPGVGLTRATPEAPSVGRPTRGPFLDRVTVFPLVMPFQPHLFVLTEILATLRGHSGLVKGLTWDPVGKYIASQADDRSLKVWRTLDWQLETSITKPFDEVRGLAGPPPPPPASHTEQGLPGVQTWSGSPESGDENRSLLRSY